jgi:hypothetical protein
MDSINQTDVISYFERINGLIAKNTKNNELIWNTFLFPDLFHSSRVDKVPEIENKDCQLGINIIALKLHYGNLHFFLCHGLLKF